MGFKVWGVGFIGSRALGFRLRAKSSPQVSWSWHAICACQQYTHTRDGAFNFLGGLTFRAEVFGMSGQYPDFFFLWLGELRCKQYMGDAAHTFQGTYLTVSQLATLPSCQPSSQAAHWSFGF